MKEVVRAHGHENVRAEHASTWELTTDDWLTPAGDCILAVEADRTPTDFVDGFVAACRSADARIEAAVEVGGEEFLVEGRGHPDLTFESDRSMVARTSDYVDDRTIMVRADAAARDFPQSMIGALADGADIVCTLRVE